MNHDATAKAGITIQAPISKVWDALVNPEVIKRYMFGTTVTSHWVTGSPITWKGEWKGKAYEDTPGSAVEKDKHMINIARILGYVIRSFSTEMPGSTRPTPLQPGRPFRYTMTSSAVILRQPT
jgi:hypothetical protein